MHVPLPQKPSALPRWEQLRPRQCKVKMWLTSHLHKDGAAAARCNHSSRTLIHADSLGGEVALANQAANLLFSCYYYIPLLFFLLLLISRAAAEAQEGQQVVHCPKAWHSLPSCSRARHCATTLARVYSSECWLMVWCRSAAAFPSGQLHLLIYFTATCTTMPVLWNVPSGKFLPIWKKAFMPFSQLSACRERKCENSRFEL